MNNQRFTFSILTENKIGLVQEIVIVFTRRKINIESLTASETEVKGIYRFTVVIDAEEQLVAKLVGQIEKIVNVIKVYLYKQDQMVAQELALYKIRNISDSILSSQFQVLIETYNARILAIDPNYIIVEKTGNETQIFGLLEELESFEVLGFIRSGVVAIGKSIQQISKFIKELEDSSQTI